MKVDDSFLYVGQLIISNMESAITKKSDLVTLLEIKNMIEMSSLRMQNMDSGTNLTRLHSEMKNLNKKFDDLKDVVVGIKKKGDSPRKTAMKKEIISLLKEHRRLNPAKLANLIGLSRVRANEYLREMEQEKITKGLIINKKRFYMLEEDLKKSPISNLYTIKKP